MKLEGSLRNGAPVRARRFHLQVKLPAAKAICRTGP
jgi:hypothetical protein